MERAADQPEQVFHQPIPERALRSRRQIASESERPTAIDSRCARFGLKKWTGNAVATFARLRELASAAPSGNVPPTGWSLRGIRARSSQE